VKSKQEMAVIVELYAFNLFPGVPGYLKSDIEIGEWAGIL